MIGIFRKFIVNPILRDKRLNARIAADFKRENIVERFRQLVIENEKFEYQRFKDFKTQVLSSQDEQEWRRLVIEAFVVRAQAFKGDVQFQLLLDFIEAVEKDDPILSSRLNAQLPKPHAFIKNLAIEINPAYDFNNSPFSAELGDPKSFFIGRERNLNKFIELLNSNTKKGVFLVTGYRGMGKTSFVNNAIRAYAAGNKEQALYGAEKTRQKAKEVKVINLNLAQKDPAEIDILKLIVSHLYNDYNDRYAEGVSRIVKWLKIGIIAVTCILISGVIWNYRFYFSWLLDQRTHTAPASVTLQDTAQAVQEYVRRTRVVYPEPGIWQFRALILVITDLLLIAATAIILTDAFGRRISAGKIIRKLYKRCYAASSLEKNSQHEISIEKISASIKGPYEKETTNYPIASSKEIEYELYRFLKIVQEQKDLEFIFVFDELDKIESAAITTDYYEDNNPGADRDAYLHQMRQRKQSVVNIIAGLKNFLTTAQARFVFIAGREMFDATLADVADRQSSISSIFNYVFYIESFLKENIDQDNVRSSLSSSIEHYLIYVVFGIAAADQKDQNLFDLLFDRYEKEKLFLTAELKNWEWQSRNLAGEGPKEYALNQVIVGKKKLIKLDQGYWKSLVVLQNFIIYLTYRSNGSPKKIIKLIQEFIRIERPDAFDNDANYFLKRKPGQSADQQKKAYLFFGFDDQYRMGFINHLYRPFLIRYGQSFNKYSDNIILSTTYLFDHLLKFHPFAFSIPNLELTPEVLSTNKTPLLREHILTIIEYLSNNHLRETEIGIFDYKFYSRTQSELIYISKTFETEAAAFNFTLDEGYLIKLHIRNELKNLREIHTKLHEKSSSMSLSHLNGILGDLHFFDQEYDDAIVAYSDCIKLLDGNVKGIEIFVRAMRFKLKLGLTLEKVKSYDEALAYYADASKQAIVFFREKETDVSDHPVMHDLLQIVNQSFIAMIVLQEKMGIDGISLHNVLLSVSNFNALSAMFAATLGKNLLINANLYLLTGNVLYFKNNHSESLDGIQHLENRELLKGIISGLSYTKAAGICHSLSFYYQGLKLLINNGEGKGPLPAQGHRNFLWPLFRQDAHGKAKLGELLSERNFTRNEYKYLAIFFSHIGDVLLSSIRNQRDAHTGMANYDNVELEDIFKTETTGEYSDISEFLQESTADDIGIKDVLRCYYWAGYFFEKRGRAVSHSFQLRKMLYVLHMVVPDSGGKTNAKHAAYINQLEILILRPILDIAGRTAENSDRHMLNKFKKSKFETLEKHDDRFEVFLNNNISNHPDTREAVALFLYLRVKVKPPDENDDQRYRRFISPNNSFATQYTRIYELTFWAKYNKVAYERSLSVPSGQLGTNPDPSQQLKYALEYLHAQFSCLLMIDIYGVDYTISHSLKGYIHFKVAEFIERFRKEHTEAKVMIAQINNYISTNIGYNPKGAMEDVVYHYAMAQTHTEKARQLHQQGQEYRRNMDNLIYLEDDINDNAYHFGAAIDRFLILNGCFDMVIETSKKKIIELKFKVNNINMIADKFF